MVVFQRKTLVPQLTTGEVPGTIYGLSASGWMDRELFQEWFHHHFLQHVPASRPLLLLLDGHSSHYSLECIREASLEGVIIFCLPPHTTHITQPLDVSAFHALKVYWDSECDKFVSPPRQTYHHLSIFFPFLCRLVKGNDSANNNLRV